MQYSRVQGEKKTRNFTDIIVISVSSDARSRICVPATALLRLQYNLKVAFSPRLRSPEKECMHNLIRYIRIFKIESILTKALP